MLLRYLILTWGRRMVAGQRYAAPFSLSLYFQSRFIGRSEGLVVPIECDQRTMEQLISGPAPLASCQEPSLLNPDIAQLALWLEN